MTNGTSDIDEILGLIEDIGPSPAKQPAPKAVPAGTTGSKPDFNELFGERKPGFQTAPTPSSDLDPTSTFPVIQYNSYPEPKVFFDEKTYYQRVLSGIGEESKRFHTILGQFMACKDLKDKSILRGKLISAGWNYLEKLAASINPNIEKEKLFVLRYGLVLPTVITPDQKKMLSCIIRENTYGEPVYYQDEWLLKLAAGEVSTSATDETKVPVKNETQKIQSQLDKVRGQHETSLALARKLSREIEALESTIIRHAQTIAAHPKRMDVTGVLENISPQQKSAINEISESLRQLQNNDRELGRFLNEFDKHRNELENLSQKSSEMNIVMNVDSEAILKEYRSLRQMGKLNVGRKGNHFNFLFHSYFRPTINDIGTRENVIRAMAEIERLDPGLFLRTFKNNTNRIVPYIILLPNYGEFGICWEPFERHNRATGRGRVAIPMYPKDLKIAVLCAMADLRWQVAKEKAQHYWMEEGITGKYYQWFSEKKIRGDVKEYFIQDYILWITRESEGTQKLDRDVRGIFWRNIPFPQDLKDSLRNRGFVYNELYKKDQNRAMSDGY